MLTRTKMKIDITNELADEREQLEWLQDPSNFEDAEKKMYATRRVKASISMYEKQLELVKNNGEAVIDEYVKDKDGRVYYAKLLSTSRGSRYVIDLPTRAVWVDNLMPRSLKHYGLKQCPSKAPVWYRLYKLDGENYFVQRYVCKYNKVTGLRNPHWVD